MDGPRLSGGVQPIAFGALLGCALVVVCSWLPAKRIGVLEVSAAQAEGGLSEARTWTPRSLAMHPGQADDRPRLRVVLTDQRLLHRASARLGGAPVSPRRPGSTRLSAMRSPIRLTAHELKTAAEMEVRRDSRIQRLVGVRPAVERSLERARRKIRSLGGRVIAGDLLPASLLVRIPAQSVDPVRRLPGVAAVLPEPRPRRLLDVSSEVIGAPAWWSAGHTGGTGTEDWVSADAAVLSEAPDPTHPAFDGVDIVNQPGLIPGGHGTSTGGIIASSDGNYPGIAYGVDTLIGAGGPAYALGLYPGAPVGDPAEVMSLSFGSPALADEEGILGDLPVAVFNFGKAEAAGNDHNPAAGPTVNNIGRNILSVAAYSDVGSLNTADDVVASFSSRGPSPGGRKKPDLTAPGVGIMAPVDGSPAFDLVDGTSFSTPHVAGAMTLLAGAGILDPMIQRAILINSARDWTASDTGLNGWSHQTGWRPEVGWGALDLTTAFAERGNYAVSEVREGEAAYFRASGLDAGEKSTMAFELRGFWPDYPQPGSQALVFTQSNLDLRQYHEHGEEVPPPEEFVPPSPGEPAGPDAVDPNDTVEQVRAPGGGGDMVLKVEAASKVEGVEAEPFAITSAVPLDPLIPPHVRPSAVGVSPADTVACGVPVTISARAENPSPDLAATGAQLSIDLPAGVRLKSGPMTQQVSGGELGTGETSETHEWVVVATAHGSHKLKLRGYGEAYGTGAERRGPAISFTADCSPPQTSITAGPQGTISSTSATFGFGSSDPSAAIRCALDGAPFTSCGRSATFSSLSAGEHVVYAQAVDRVGNADPTPASRSFVVAPPAQSLSPKLKVKSRSFRPRKQSVGSMRVRLPRPGVVTIRSKARWRGARAPIRRVRVSPENGRAKVNLRTSRRTIRRVRRALRRDHRVRIIVQARFSDADGNRGAARLRYRLRGRG